MRFLPALFVFLLSLVPGFSQAASTPAPQIGDECSQEQLGTMQISDDRENLIACLKTGSVYAWKSVTANAAPSQGGGDVWLHWYGQNGQGCDAKTGAFCPPKIYAYTCPDGYIVTAVESYEGMSGGYYPNWSDGTDNLGITCSKFH